MNTFNTDNKFDKLLKLIVFLFGIILLLSGIFLSFQNKTASASITYGTAILCFIFSFLTSFSRFEGFGIKAELLDMKIKEADEIINKLQIASLPMADAYSAQTDQLFRRILTTRSALL